MWREFFRKTLALKQEIRLYSRHIVLEEYSAIRDIRVSALIKVAPDNNDFTKAPQAPRIGLDWKEIIPIIKAKGDACSSTRQRPTITINKENKMSNNLDQMANHLQFLGYEVKTEGELRIAKHPKKMNVMLRLNRGGVLFTAINGVKDEAKNNRGGYLNFINMLNSKASVVRFYADKDSDFFMEAWYPDYYDRTMFGTFIDAWETETTTLLFAQGDEALKFLK
jgi:hypothetical protein